MVLSSFAHSDYGSSFTGGCSCLQKSTAGCLDCWAWNEIIAPPLPWFSGLAVLLGLIESTCSWPQGLLDSYIAMIPKADGDSTLLGQRPLSVLPVVYKLWASLWLGHLREWVEVMVCLRLRPDSLPRRILTSSFWYCGG